VRMWLRRLARQRTPRDRPHVPLFHATMPAMKTQSAKAQSMKTQCAERIFLLGPPGSGKSAVGAQLAALLGWRFLDTDALVERAAGCGIPDLFAREGEAAFREREAAALAEAAAGTRVVVATGGGIGEREGNLALLRERGWRVTLSVTPQTAWERLRPA